MSPSPLWESAPADRPPGRDELHVQRASLVLDEDALAQAERLLSPDETDRAARFVFARDRRRYIAARAHLRRILGAVLHEPPHALAFEYGAWGKPVLRGQRDGQGLCFNLAHSGDLVLYALAWARRVGVDLEQVRGNLDWVSLLPQIFSAAERERMARLAEDEGRAAFYRGWVAKEACIKAMGRGLSFDPSLVEVAPSALGNALHLPDTEHDMGWTLHPLDVEVGYAAAAVTEGGSARLRCFESARETQEGH